MDTSDKLPFDGVKIADFSWVWVGPTSTKYLADHGATVVRVESLSRPDILHSLGPHKNREAAPTRTHAFSDFNTSKLGLSLNLKTPEATEIAKRLISWADSFSATTASWTSAEIPQATSEKAAKAISNKTAMFLFIVESTP